jgi:hypothetical protein
LSSLAQKNASADATLNLCSTSEEKSFIATAEVSLNPVNDLDVQTKGTMKADILSSQAAGFITFYCRCTERLQGEPPPSPTAIPLFSTWRLDGWSRSGLAEILALAAMSVELSLYVPSGLREIECRRLELRGA